MKKLKRKTKRVSKRVAVTLVGLGLSATFGVNAQTVRKVNVTHRAGTSATASNAAIGIDSRWKDSFAEFAAYDKAHAPREGGVLFVGSSSIRLWNDLETQFETAVVTKRGFGGSRLLDCANHVDQLVLPYKPRLVVVYAGDNDLAEGRSPRDVLQSFAEFVERVREVLPDTRIAYLSIKPSPLRAALMPLAIETNALIASYSAATPNLDYIDIFSKMLDADGKPRADLFLADALHLNAAGYAVWKTEISSHLGTARLGTAHLESAVASRAP